MQNHSKCKIAERLSLPEIKDDILQICYSDARIQVEQMTVQDTGIQIEGVLHIRFMYVRPDDQIPFALWHTFTQSSSTSRTCTRTLWKYVISAFPFG